MIKKSNINNAATKDDVKKLATQKKLKQVEKNLHAEILKVEERVENLEDGQKSIESKIDKVEQRLGEKIDKVFNKLDRFVGRVDDLTTDNEVGAHQVHELRTVQKVHEKRISKLESATHTT